MAEFISYDPHVEVRGEVLLAWLAGTQRKILPYLNDCGILQVEAGAWYPLQPALDALNAFGQSGSLFNAGLLIPEHAVFPPGLQTMEDVLNALDTAYHLNHRSGEIGHYFIEQVDAHHITVTAENPYPCEFDFGLLRYIAEQFGPGGVEVVHDAHAPCRRLGDESCTYHLKWGDGTGE